jgi:RHS repeat-associated protein
VYFCYDANGNNTFEGTRTRIAYNEINLPQQVQLLGGRGIKNVYAADGRKLKSEAKQGSEYIKEGTKTYCGNLVFDINDELDYIIFSEGRIVYDVDDSTFNYEYHLKDHLGSTRVAFSPPSEGSGEAVVQENNYYPFGAPIADLSWSPHSTNRYLRESKEYISDFDWNKYDFTGRTFDSWTLRALQIDPMATKYYNTSPYVLWINNPLRVIDPTGMFAENPQEGDYDEDEDLYYSRRFGWVTPLFYTYLTEEGYKYSENRQVFDIFLSSLHEEQNTSSGKTAKETQPKTVDYYYEAAVKLADAASEIMPYIPFVGSVYSYASDQIQGYESSTLLLGLALILDGIPGGGTMKGAKGSTSLIKTEIQFSKHSLERLAQRGVTRDMAELAISKGQKFYDPFNKSINYVLSNGFASGKSLLVGTNPLTGEVTTVIQSSKNLINRRFVPIK